jgi:hypothetical protein
VLVALALPAAASANDFQNVYRVYKRTGTIKPCRFSDKELANAEKETPPDVAQYAPSFLDALDAARQGGAGCHKKAAPAPAPAPAPTTPAATPPPASTPTPTPPPVTTATAATPTPPAPTPPAQPVVAGVPSPPVQHPVKDSSAPSAVWLLVVLAAAIVLCAVFAGLAWWFGWDTSRYLPRWGSSWDDFGSRLSSLGTELRDWLRTGF